MHWSIWIVSGALGVLVAAQIVRGVLLGRRERRRLEALFKRVAASSCPLCRAVYGPAVRENIQITFKEDEPLPLHLAKVQRLNLWRITCPHCPDVALLAENEEVFELLRPLDLEAGKE